MNKKGISPLIASVLLIAFAVTLFLIISTWVQRSVVEPGLEEGGEKVARSLDCMSARVSLSGVCSKDTSSPADGNDNYINVDIDNEGDVDLIGYQIRVIGEDGVEVITKVATLAQLDRVSIDAVAGALTKSIGKVTGLEVYPEITSGYCKSNPATTSRVVVCN